MNHPAALICSRCRRSIDTHPADGCLDRWIHEAFFGHAVTADTDNVPPYSTIDAVDALLDAQRWPTKAVLLCRPAGWFVLVDNAALAAADSPALAVCRAALKIPPGGQDRLTVTTPLH